MLDALTVLIRRHWAILNFELSYTKITDWTIVVEHRIAIGESEKIVEVQDGDLMRCAAEAYLKTTEWLSEHNGGY